MDLPPLAMIDGAPVLFTMAADAEYGPHLRSRFRPLMTGVGPVEAGIHVASALAALAAAGSTPRLVVCLGSAGSRSLEQTAIYQASSVSYRDMDASPLGFPKGATPFLDLPAKIDLAAPVAGLPAASLSTGANIVTGAAYDAVDAEMVDMETYAVKRAAMRHAIPVIGLRGISDGAADLRHVSDWTEYLHVIDERLADAVDLLESTLAKGSWPSG